MSATTSHIKQSPDATQNIPHPGQWRLARIDLVNWGTFSGFHSLPVSRKGLLVTGESGSGKSSLLDAETTVLTPPRNRHLNAAARSDGAKGEDRTIYSYIRGAWSNETDSSGEVSSSFLRARTAVWSGILLRYECGLEPETQPVSLLALFHLKAGCTNRDGASEMYVVSRGDCTLADFEPYVSNGLDLARLNREQKGMAKGFRDHPSFASYFTRLLGIRGTKTLELLHRTQAAKNFGSLDDLFRRFMLDEPPTKEQAKIATEQFSALDQAHNDVIQQRQQMEQLQPLIQLDKENNVSQEEITTTKRLIEALDGYAEYLAIDCLEIEEEQRTRKADQLSTAIHNAQDESQLAGQALAQMEAALNDAGGYALDNAEMLRLEYERQLKTVQSNRSALADDLASVGLNTAPLTRATWNELVRSVTREAELQGKAQEESKDITYAQFGLVDQLKKEITEADNELRHLRRQPTNIPRAWSNVRTDIVKHLGIPTEDLPFVGELLSVRADELPWQGAIERVLGPQAKTLLVAKRYTQEVARYLDSTHLGLHFEFESVPDYVEVSGIAPSPNSLIRKVSVKQHEHFPEYSRWTNNLLRTKFDYVCVASSDQLTHHRQALTIAGQIKRRNRYIKNDKFKISDKTHWILGDTNEEKIGEILKKQGDLRELLTSAEQAADGATERITRTLNLVRLANQLKKAEWESYDEETAKNDLKHAQNHCNTLKESDPETDSIRQARDEAHKRKKLADDAFQEASLDVRENERRLADVQSKIATHRQNLSAIQAPTPEDIIALDALFAACKFDKKVGETAVYQISTQVANRLNRQKDTAAEVVRKTKSSIERILLDYKRDWPTPAADLTAEFGDRDAYISIYRRIKSSGLPDYEEKFLKVLNDFSRDQITVIAATIRDAIREVKDKIRLVNKSLELSEYSPGIHLQIEAKECRSSQVHDFLADLKAITEGSWGETDITTAEQRYLRTARVITRLKSDTYADTVWQRACLDTRQHVTFIAKEINTDKQVQSVHASDVGLSGGQKQKLVIFCLAAALRYQLADEDEPIPSYGTVVLDEAFDKADHHFAATAMNIFKAFGFHMVLATPMKLLQTIEEHIGGIAHIHCHERKHSTISLVDIQPDKTAPSSTSEAPELYEHTAPIASQHSN